MRGIKRGLIVATSITLLGAIIFLGGMTMAKWNFAGFSTRKMQTKEYEISEDFSNISITADTAKINFVPAEDGKSKIICYEEVNAAHEVKVENDTLIITENDKRTWIDYIGFNFSKPKVTVYLPAGEYGSLKIESSTGDISLPKELKLNSIDIEVSTGDVHCYASATGAMKIKASTGDIKIENVSAGSLDLSVSTGEVKASGVNSTGDVTLTVSTGKSFLNDLRCRNFTTTGNTGDITLDAVIIAEKLSIKRTTGDVDLENSDAGEIFIETDTGDVEGTLLSEKVFIPRTNTGKIDVPKTTTGGICEITTSTGDIEIDIKGK